MLNEPMEIEAPEIASIQPFLKCKISQFSLAHSNVCKALSSGSVSVPEEA